MNDPRSIRRHEDPPLLTGDSRYVADLSFEGQVSMMVIRSPIAHGLITSIDTSGAAASEGVMAVWTAADLKADLGAVPRIHPRVSFDEVVVPYLQPILAIDRVRYVGEPIAVVFATDRYLAEDAAEQVFVEVDQLPVVVDPLEAAEAESLFPEGNLITTLEASFGEPDVAIERAPVVVRAELKIGRHTAIPMETRGIVVDYDSTADRCIVYGATKVPHWNRTATAELLGIDPARIAMRETSVGGGFGVRGELYPEDVLAVWASLRLKRPVKWIEDRREHMVAANHSREQHHNGVIAGDRDGRITAMSSEFWVDLGGYVRTHGIRVPDLTLSMLPGPYDIANYTAAAHCLVTNRTPTATYRAPGRFESCFVRERLIDLFAAEIGMDPAEVRRRNLIPPDRLPYSRPLHSTGEPVVLSEADYRELFEQVVDAIDWDLLAERRGRGERVGAGVAMFLEKSGLGPWENGAVTVTPDGSISVRSGASSVGQGLRTVLAQVVADALEVDPSAVQVEFLDTDKTPLGIGSYASRSTVTAGSAVQMASEAIIEQAREVAAAELEIDPADLEYRQGGIEVRGDRRTRLKLGELATLAAAADDDDAGGTTALAVGLHAERRFDVDRVVYPHGAHGAVVRVDEETGSVTIEQLVLGYDIGRAVNPVLVEGQMTGGALQAVGGALYESFAYDEFGNPLVTSFMDYLLPTLSETPPMTVIISEDSPTTTNPLGVKGAGEGGIPGVAAAIAAGIDQALGRPGGVRSVPAGPEYVLALARST